ncbi:hypothetical protein LIER_06600 [Lithospermum erythrorhizon]|uniref:Reverse transcriptase domain-containing protein n=1 Tax=Lithospermum erythrorhizon TaxID=34254 RepID=A0AAV3P546_LITER
MNYYADYGYPERFIAWVKTCVTGAWFSVSINGSLQGHFKSSRSLMQRDPISPYLFIIIMEFFTKFLKSQKAFQYHPKCQKVGLVNVNFADDLFILSGVDEESMRLINYVLAEFGKMCGLHPNLSKSSSYIAGVSDQQANNLSRILEIPISVLPVRLVLIKTVIFGIYNYWCQSVFFPVQVIHDIEKLIKAYLWKGDVNGSYLPKISWKQMVLKKDEGGLGLKDIYVWNLACMAKHIWNVCIEKEALWSKLLHLRDIIRPHVKMQVRNGMRTNYLFDNWHEEGCLVDFLDAKSITYPNIESTQTIAEVSNTIRWPVGRANTSDVQVFRNEFPRHFDQTDDCLVWFRDTSCKATNVWNKLRSNSAQVWWWKVVWFKGHIPRFSFICWILLLNRMPTRDRLK